MSQKESSFTDLVSPIRNLPKESVPYTSVSDVILFLLLLSILILLSSRYQTNQDTKTCLVLKKPGVKRIDFLICKPSKLKSIGKIL